MACGLDKPRRTARLGAQVGGESLGDGLPPFLGADVGDQRRLTWNAQQQFARAGTDGLESRELWELPEVRREGGLAALRTLGKPSAVLLDAKERMFAA